MLRYAGLFTYACVGIPLLVLESIDGQLPRLTSDSLGWAVSYVIFGLSYWEITHDLDSDVGTTRRRLLLLLMCESAVAISYFSESGLASVLLLVIAGVLPWTLPVRLGIAALIMETVALVPVFSQRVEGYGWFEAMLQCGLYFGFSSFTFVTSLVAKGQSEAREEQRRLISELRATRALLAESTRMNERVRISRELHDLLGHHLTALALNLEVASHLVQGQAQEHVRKAQSVAKLLLSDVREAVSQLRAGDEVDLE
jgi:signal transduction histidine kinase